MGRIDAETKAFMSDPFRFADVFNYLIYGGQQVIKPEDLKPLDATEIAIPYGNNARVPEQKYRDVLKLVSIMQDGKAVYVVLGGENQSKVNYAMPVKDMVYDALHYAKQVEAAKKSYGPGDGLTEEEFLSGFRKDDRLMPVITLVIYFGSDAWDGPMCIHDMLNTADRRLLRFVPDYRINLIAPALVPDEDFVKFTSDFREVFEFIKYSRDKEKLTRLTRENGRFSQMNPETAALINLATDARLKLTVKEGKVDMCLAIREMRDESMAAGRREGILEGKREGILEGKREGILEGKLKAYAEMAALGAIDVRFAAKQFDMTVDEFIQKTGIAIPQN